MGWDAGLFRKLAVPLALEEYRRSNENRVLRTLRLSEEDSEDSRVLLTLATNRLRLKKLEMDLEADKLAYDPDDITEELDFVEASVRVSLLELSGELHEIPYAEQIFEEALA